MSEQKKNNPLHVRIQKWWKDNIFKSKKDKELESKKLYRAIEIAIIKWSNNGKRTAGSLTREILKIVKKE